MTCEHSWEKTWHGSHPTKISFVWTCKKCEAQIDSIKKPSEQRKVKAKSYTVNWKNPTRSIYFG